MINDYAEVGLKIIDIDSFNKSLKAIWIKKYLDTENTERGDETQKGGMNKIF